MNILILEDNAHVSDRLKNLIEKNVNNAEVFLCSNVDEAWLKINKYRIDLFLLDIILDEKNKNDSSGILFAQSVREIAKYKMTPIIFVTSLIGWEADLLKTIHCYDYIEKPLGDGKIAISKILNAIEAIQSRPIPKRVEYIPLHYDGIGYMLAVKDIICIENKKGVLYVYLKDEKIEIPRISLKKAGQLQRIAIARALLKKPDVLILDEATANLDMNSEEKMLENIKNYLPNCTVIFITHRFTLYKDSKLFQKVLYL